MGRLPDIDEAKLTSAQRIIYEQIMRARGHMRGPFAVWLRNAELCENTLKLQEMFASRVKLERRLLELMILVSARLATAQYAWFIHAPHALKFGIAPEIIEAIRERRTPEFSREDENESDRVGAQLANKAGYAPASRKIEVTRGAPRQHTFRLAEGNGTVQLEGVPPGSAVYVDDTPTDPRRPFTVTVGTHKVRVEGADDVVFADTIDVRAGEQTVRIRAADRRPR